MGFFNPISYFIKSFIRIFTRKFFWVILILICLFLGFILFNNNGVFAESNLTFNESYITNDDITNARNKVGTTIWDDDSYDIFIHYNAGTGTKCVTYFRPSLEFPSVNYSLIQGSGVVNNYRFSALKLMANGSTANRSQVICKSLWNDWSETMAAASSTTSVNCYWFYSTQSDLSSVLCKPIRTHYDILDSDGNIIFAATNPVVVSPYFITTQEQLETYDFDYLQISGGSTNYTNEFPVGFNNTAEITLTYVSQNIATNIDITNFLTVTDNKWSINIPYNYLTNNTVVRNGNDFFFKLEYKLYGETGYIISRGGTYNLTTEQETQINEDSDKQVQGEILQQQQQTNEKLDNLDKSQQEINNNLTDSHVDDDVTDNLLEFDTNLEHGDVIDAIDRFFNIIYNAFTINVAEDIIVPFPFTDKNITIPVTYTETYVPLRIRTIIATCVWGVIGIYIYKRVMTIIDFVQSGEFDLVFKNGDVKKEEL